LCPDKIGHQGRREEEDGGTNEEEEEEGEDEGEHAKVQGREKGGERLFVVEGNVDSRRGGREGGRGRGGRGLQEVQEEEAGLVGYEDLGREGGRGRG